METWDPQAAQHLTTASAVFTDSGFIDLLHVAAVDTWRANRERYEPEDLYDDASTLGYQTSKNLANRMYAYLGSQRRLQDAGVTVSKEQNVVVFRAGGFDLRLVKAPASTGRLPRFTSDFDWHDRESRFAAASRNARAYNAPTVVPGMEPLFNIERTGAVDAVKACRDVFLVWSGDIASGLTGGWLGLPTISTGSWMAVEPMWWDEDGSLNNAQAEGEPGPSAGSDFRSKQAPVPVVTLKPGSDRKISR